MKFEGNNTERPYLRRVELSKDAEREVVRLQSLLRQEWSRMAYHKDAGRNPDSDRYLSALEAANRIANEINNITRGQSHASHSIQEDASQGQELPLTPRVAPSQKEKLYADWLDYRTEMLQRKDQNPNDPRIAELAEIIAHIDSERAKLSEEELRNKELERVTDLIAMQGLPTRQDGKVVDESAFELKPNTADKNIARFEEIRPTTKRGQKLP